MQQQTNKFNIKYFVYQELFHASTHLRVLSSLIAFTLAEVLITLTIVGVIAALVIPPLANYIADIQYKSAYKKAVSVANQAYTEAVQDNGGGFGAFTSNTTTSYTKFDALKSKMVVIQDCLFNSTIQGVCWSNSGVGQKGYSVPSCSMFSNLAGAQFVNTSFVSKDGMFWMLYSYSTTTGSDYLAVDINGNKGPNDWGKDAFILRMDDRSINPDSSGCTPNLKRNDGTILTGNEFVDALLN